MIFSAPIPFAEALASRKVKRLMPTTASARELEALEPQLKERAFFMARVNHLGMVAETHSTIGRMLEDGVDMNKARTDLKEYLVSIGYDPANPPEGFEPAKPGSLRDLSSDARLNVVLDTNMGMANGYGQFAKANDPAILDDYPCWELVRNDARIKERSWRQRWVEAGGKLSGSSARMIATKDDPIWSNLGPFKLPYPPFDYNSGMGVEEVDREEAEALGVIKPSTVVAPQDRGFNDGVKGSVPRIGEEFDVVTERGLGHFSDLSEGVATMKPVQVPAVSKYNAYKAELEGQYGEHIYRDATDAELGKLEALEKLHYKAKGSISVGEIDDPLDKYKEKASSLNDYKPLIPESEFSDPSNIIPINLVDERYVDDLIKSIGTKGWSGEPIVVADTAAGRRALTGSHRLAAAEKLEIDVPVYVVDPDKIEEFAKANDWFSAEMLQDGGDHHRAELLRQVGDQNAVKLLEKEIDANEKTDRRFIP